MDFLSISYFYSRFDLTHVFPIIFLSNDVHCEITFFILGALYIELLSIEVVSTLSYQHLLFIKQWRIICSASIVYIEW